jgi:hypothetical protein
MKKSELLLWPVFCNYTWHVQLHACLRDEGSVLGLISRKKLMKIEVTGHRELRHTISWTTNKFTLPKPLQWFLCSRWRYRACTPHCAGAAASSWRTILTAASGLYAVCRNTTLPATIFSEATLPFTECTPVPPRPVTAAHRYKNCYRGRALADITNIIITAGEEMIPALTSKRYTDISH